MASRGLPAATHSRHASVLNLKSTFNSLDQYDFLLFLNFGLGSLLPALFT